MHDIVAMCPSFIQVQTIVGACLPSSRASLGMTSCGVAVASTPSRCAPPTITGEFENGSAWCGSGRRLPLSRRRHLLVHASHRCRLSLGTTPHGVAAAGASHHHERVWERLRIVWQRLAPLAGGRCPLSMRASHHHGEVWEWLYVVWRRPAALVGVCLPPSWASSRMAPRGVAAAGAPCRCVPPTVRGEFGNGSARCDGGQPPSVARLPPLWASPRMASYGVAAAGAPYRCAPPPLWASSGMALRGVAVTGTPS
jgi:hypothetical protein